jgi:hypothetical protein
MVVSELKREVISINHDLLDFGLSLPELQRLNLWIAKYNDPKVNQTGLARHKDAIICALRDETDAPTYRMIVRGGSPERVARDADQIGMLCQIDFQTAALGGTNHTNVREMLRTMKERGQLPDAKPLSNAEAALLLGPDRRDFRWFNSAEVSALIRILDLARR